MTVIAEMIFNIIKIVNKKAKQAGLTLKVIIK